MAKNKYEDHLAAQMDWAGYKYQREYRFFPKRLWRADFFLPDYDILVEVDGVKFRGVGRHQSALGFEQDCEKINSAIALGFRVLRFTPRMVMGKATRGKSKIKMDSAIEVIDKVVLAGFTYDRTKRGYAVAALRELPDDN